MNSQSAGRLPSNIFSKGPAQDEILRPFPTAGGQDAISTRHNENRSGAPGPCRGNGSKHSPSLYPDPPVVTSNAPGDEKKGRENNSTHSESSSPPSTSTYLRRHTFIEATYTSPSRPPSHTLSPLLPPPKHSSSLRRRTRAADLENRCPSYLANSLLPPRLMSRMSQPLDNRPRVRSRLGHYENQSSNRTFIAGESMLRHAKPREQALPGLRIVQISRRTAPKATFQGAGATTTLACSVRLLLNESTDGNG
ncbi:MAG: hypothetical protein Q9223_001145 [Gallowayella weberi]